MLGIPEMVEDAEGFFTLSISEHKDIHFFSILPLYEEEMDFKLKHGAEPLFEKLEKEGINELLNVKRKNVCKKSFWFF
ncbi:Suppressor of fused protein (SUFU) [compost metagenome]